MGKGHSHAIPENKNEKILWFALALTFSFFFIEIVAGIALNSLALLADGAHMFTDVAALGIALAAIKIAKRPADARRTYGYHRFEILAATFNALLLFIVAVYILFEACQRFGNPEEVQPIGILVIATIGFIVNFSSMRLLHNSQFSSLNVKGAYLEVWSDMLGSIGVIFSAIIIYFTRWFWVDTVIAISIGFWVLPRAWVLLKESLNILLEGVPEGIDVEEVANVMRSVPGVLNVHDLHIWVINSGKNSLAAHVVHNDNVNSSALIKDIQGSLEKRFKMFHITLQCEDVACDQGKEGCNFIKSANNFAENNFDAY
ncbi:MAG TPA: cation diffusion facilitator family transporter [Gammaproteobacteria bacterium]|nr:cation diffusion facilitator family transporter [Gammaproteobacteria bacterium]